MRNKLEKCNLLCLESKLWNAFVARLVPNSSKYYEIGPNSAESCQIVLPHFPKLVEISGNEWEFVEFSRNLWKLMEISPNYWKLMEIHGN